MTFEEIRAQCRAAKLDIYGGFHPSPEDQVPGNAKTLLLLGPDEPGFWETLTTSPEWAQDDPVDRWSQRVIGALAASLGARAHFPFGGPPHLPFFRWATASGAAWQSPVTILVQARAGLMASYRGALAFDHTIDLPPPPASPCLPCPRPCDGACPVGALTGEGYDTDACHVYLDTEAGQDCMTRGCAVRRACPVSQSYGRLEAQSAYHMSVFHK